MEQQTNSNTNTPTLCRSGCGFYGSSSMDGMCSKCYKDALNRKMQPPTNSSSVGSVSPAVNIASSAQSSASTPSGLASASSSFHDLSTSPIGIPSASNIPFSSSVPTHLTAHLPHPASSINLTTATSGSTLSSDSALSTSPSSASLPGSFSDPSSPMSEASKKKNRCAECNKKVGLTGFECRCGGMYCSVHRYSDVHKCNFDYKQMGADEIRKNNPAVRGEKVQKL